MNSSNSSQKPPRKSSGPKPRYNLRTRKNKEQSATDKSGAYAAFIEEKMRKTYEESSDEDFVDFVEEKPSNTKKRGLENSEVSATASKDKEELNEEIREPTLRDSIVDLSLEISDDGEDGEFEADDGGKISDPGEEIDYEKERANRKKARLERRIRDYRKREYDIGHHEGDDLDSDPEDKQADVESFLPDIDDILNGDEDDLDRNGNLKDLINDDEELYDPVKGLPNHEREDWMLDTALLSTIIQNTLIKKFPNLAEEKDVLYDGIADALKTADEGLVDRYCGVKTNSSAIKILFPQEQAEELGEVLDDTIKAVEDDEPTMLKIVQTHMTMADRKILFQLFDIYKNTEPYTEDYLNIRNRLIKGLSDASKNVDERIEAANIEEELMKDQEATDSNSLILRILNLDAEDHKKRIMVDIHRQMEETNRDSSMYRNSKEKLEYMTALPYRRMVKLPVDSTSTHQQINEFCANVRDKLDNDPDYGLYGLEDAKEEIMTGLVNRITNPRSKMILALHGVPGTGKTALASAVAAATGLPFERVCLGGVSDVSYIAGSSGHYLGSMPSAILRAMIKMKASNGIILLDEIDKIGEDEKGQAVLNVVLHLLDYTTNMHYKDRYIAEFDHDVSNLWFMVSLNDIDRIPAPLRDRLHILDVDKYSYADLKNIIKFYNIPRIAKDIGFPSGSIDIDESACNALLSILGTSIELEGVRPIQKLVRTLLSRINLVRTTMVPDTVNAEGTSMYKTMFKTKYDLPDFKLPYLITQDTISRLIDPSKFRNTLGHRTMYL